MPHRIKTFRSLLHLVALDETDHDLREMASLLVDALRDWGNCHDIVRCIAGFKSYFGDPLTVENTKCYTGRDTEDWAWRGEAGMSLSEMIKRSIEAYQVADFDTIVDRFLHYYEQKFLLTSKGEPLSHTGFATFYIYSENLTGADVERWLGVESDGQRGAVENHWILKTPLTRNIPGGVLGQQMVKRLMPLKDRLIALKKANPTAHYGLGIVIWSSLTDFDLDNETLLFLGEIGARLESEIFPI
ncbi:MAG: hypothetical protein H6555_00415 [Lewinellaceae bacterium]|nr:hypothetical protein [Lewinellaceae bacterium]